MKSKLVLLEYHVLLYNIRLKGVKMTVFQAIMYYQFKY